MNERPRDLAGAASALESTLIKQLLQSSGAFKGNGVAGSSVNAEMFMEVLADAVAKSGGFGLAKMLEKTLAPQGGDTDGDKAAVGHPHPGVSPRMTSGFGSRIHPLTGEESFHAGIDLAAAEGVPFAAAKPGVVVAAGQRGGYGKAVEVDHGDGVSTLYAHASSLNVKPGDVVSAGETLGAVGETGQTTGPHLHFEVRVAGKAIDPKKALNAYGIRAEATIEESRNQALRLP